MEAMNLRHLYKDEIKICIWFINWIWMTMPWSWASPTSTPKFSKLFVLNLFESNLSLKTDKTQKARMTRTSPSTTSKRETHANQSTFRSLVWVGPPKAHFQDPQTCVVLWMLPPIRLFLSLSLSHPSLSMELRDADTTRVCH